MKPCVCALLLAFGVADPALSQTLLQPSDVTYQGVYEVQTNGNNSTYTQGLTTRHVSGQLRFLTLALGGRLDEFALPGAFGGKVSAPLRSWTLPAGTLDDLNGIYFEEAKNRLWLTSSTDYTNDVQPSRITIVTLPDAGGAAVLVGRWSIKGVNAKRVYGGCRPVPAWAQAQVGGPYECGSGGYTSLMLQGGGASLGPTMYAIDEPTAVPSGSELRLKKRVLEIADSGSNRGVRKTIPINYFDGGDARSNPPSRPSVPPLSRAGWLSPNGQGFGWIVWGDSPYNTSMWIDTPARRGYAQIWTLCKGACWYESSMLHYDGRQYELHIFDPSSLGKSPTLRPASMTELVLPGRETTTNGLSEILPMVGASFTDGRIYAMTCGGDASVYRYSCGVFVFAVAGGSEALPVAAPPVAAGAQGQRP